VLTITSTADLIPLSDVPFLPIVAKRLRIAGRKGPIDYSTLWRWWHDGLRGVRLEVVKIGDQPCTTQQAVADFFAAVRRADDRRRGRAVA